jgi:hypothetical protein
LAAAALADIEALLQPEDEHEKLAECVAAASCVSLAPPAVLPVGTLPVLVDSSQSAAGVNV